MDLKYFHFGICLFFLFVLKHQVTSSYVPAILWNIKGNAVHIKPISAFGNDQKIYEESLKNILNKDSSAIIFAVNSLSLEDFSAVENPDLKNNTLYSLETFLDLHPHILLSSVKDPLNKIHQVHCGVEEIIVDHALDNNVLRSVSSAIERSCAVILHLSDLAIIGKKDEIKDIFLPSFAKTQKNVIGMFTAMKSSWEVPGSHHKFRNLLAVEDENPNFTNVSGCIYVYSENATIRIGNETIYLIYPPDDKDSYCTNSTSFLKLVFAASSEIKGIELSLNFTRTPSGNWKTSNANLKINGGKVEPDEMELKGKLPEAPLRFSYSCGRLQLTGYNVSKTVTLTFVNFQVQPYEVGNKFADSFDCVPFLTIPIWMGIFVGILFIIIMNIGIYALFSIHTMDRFDDPKGKTIMVPASLD